MLYSEWVDKIWQAVGDYWLELDDRQRQVGVPCDTILLAKIGVNSSMITPGEVKDALHAVHRVLKALEGLGQLLEVLPNRFRLVDSAPKRVGESLTPLYDIYRRSSLDSSALLFLEQLAKGTVSLRTTPFRSSLSGSGPAEPSGQVEADQGAYIMITPQDAAAVFNQLGWTWEAPIDHKALEIIHALKAVGMMENTYVGGALMCAPTFKGLLRLENADRTKTE